MNKVTHNKKKLLNALEKSLGIVTTACHMTGISRSTFYNYYKSDLEFKKQVDDLESVALDFVESQLFEQIKNGVPASTIFYLKTKGKKRGYIEKMDVAVTSKQCVMLVPAPQSIDDWEKGAIEQQAKLINEAHEDYSGAM